MSKPKPRRRFLLSSLLAVGLCAAAGVGGYLWYAPDAPVLSEATQEDLDEAFASAEGNDTLDAVASAWENTWDADPPAADEVTAPDELANEPMPGSSEAPVAPLPMAATHEPYQDTQPELHQVPVAPPADRYAAAALASEEPRQASDTLARGQSPVEAPAEANPLRTASASAPVEAEPSSWSGPDDWSGPEDAFAESAPLPAGRPAGGPAATAGV